jgi:hypothetical protein
VTKKVLSWVFVATTISIAISTVILAKLGLDPVWSLAIGLLTICCVGFVYKWATDDGFGSWLPKRPELTKE